MQKNACRAATAIALCLLTTRAMGLDEVEIPNRACGQFQPNEASRLIYQGASLHTYRVCQGNLSSGPQAEIAVMATRGEGLPEREVARFKYVSPNEPPTCVDVEGITIRAVRSTTQLGTKLCVRFVD